MRKSEYAIRTHSLLGMLDGNTADYSTLLNPSTADLTEASAPLMVNCVFVT
jgi:hypothetical protein